MDSKKLKAERWKANLDLAETLVAIIKSDQGEQRFSQILRNYGFVEQIPHYHHEVAEIVGYNWADEFNLEPKSLLERVKTVCAKVFM